MVSSAESWELKGDYFESCNCNVACPCLFSAAGPMASAPTEGACEVGFAFHIDHGKFGSVALDGLNVAMAMRSPGAMGAGNMSQALYVDARADSSQRGALEAIFNGEAGGILAIFNPLISQRLGTKQVPITFKKEGNKRSVEIPGVMHLSVHPLPSMLGPDAVPTVSGVHPFNPGALVLAVGDDGNTYTDHGMRWDNSGRNGHYTDIAWSNA